MKEFDGDIGKVLEQVVVQRMVISEDDRIGIGTFQPKDEKNQDSTELTGDINYRKIAELGTDSDPRAFNFDGEFCIANRGIIEFVEVLKLDVAFLYEPPPTPPVGDVVVGLEVRDPGGTYLPRQFSVALPRRSDPALPDSVFEPVVVPLMRSPRASRSRNWAMIRVWLGVGMTDEPIAAALLRVVHDPTGDREILGWGMSVVADPRAREIELRAPGRKRWVHFGDRHLGEASVPVVGLSDQVWGVEPGEDVLLADIPATLEVVPMSLPGPARLPDPSTFFGAIVVPANTRAVTLSVGGDIHAEPFPVTI